MNLETAFRKRVVENIPCPMPTCQAGHGDMCRSMAGKPQVFVHSYRRSHYEMFEQTGRRVSPNV